MNEETKLQRVKYLFGTFYKVSYEREYQEIIKIVEELENELNKYKEQNG